MDASEDARFKDLSTCGYPSRALPWLLLRVDIFQDLTTAEIFLLASQKIAQPDPRRFRI